jgi:hypothetical protein
VTTLVSPEEDPLKAYSARYIHRARGAKTMRANEYKVIEMVVEEGLSYGWNRAHKHVENPSPEDIREAQGDAIMGDLSEWFFFEEEAPEESMSLLRHARVEYLQSMIGVTPLSPEAYKWLHERTDAASWQGETLMVDLRYAEALCAAMEEAL